MYSTNRKVLKSFIDQKEVESAKPVTRTKVKVVTEKSSGISEKSAELQTKKPVVEKGKEGSPKVTKPIKSKTKDEVKAEAPTKVKEEAKAKDPAKPKEPPKKKAESPASTEKKQASPKKELTPPKKPRAVAESSSASKGIGEKVQKRTPQVPAKTDEMDKVRDEVMLNLKELKKHISDFEEGMKGPTEKKKKKVQKGKAKSVATKGKKSSPAKKKVKKPVDNQFIEEINSLEEKEVGEKQKNQNKLIEDFVQREPEKVKDNENLTDEQVADLAKESVNFNKDLVSENLAIIFSKQGKTDKAIEIYKKLIWKYPQKKAYFATQIKDLEKKRDGSGNS